MKKKIDVISLNFPSFYVKDYETAVAFYSRVFGPPQSDKPRIRHLGCKEYRHCHGDPGPDSFRSHSL